MRKVLLILLACTLALVFALPVQTPQIANADPPGTMYVTGQNTEVEYLGNNTYRATIDSAPIYMPDLVTPIDPRWYYDINKSEWYAGANLFEVIVKNTKVTVEKDGQKMTFEPTVLVGTKDTKPILQTGQLLIVDPINENYYGNTLEWVYPDCVRHLRIIEGMLIEEFIFETDPGADIQIVSNLYKDPNFVWDRLPYAYDADGNSLEISENKVVLASEFAGAAYPVVIDPTTTFYSSTYDGLLQNTDADYTTVHDSGTANTVVDSSIWIYLGQYEAYGGDFRVRRNGLYFSTSAIPSLATITSATLSLYGLGDLADKDFYVTVVNGNDLDIPLTASDYGQLLDETTSGGSLTTIGWLTSGYNDIALTSTGRSWISKTGWTKFGLRSSLDISATPPIHPTNEEVSWYSYDKGSGYRPKLTVTYQASSSPSVTTNNANYIASTTARLNGYLSSDGGGNCEIRFEYDTDSGAPYEYTTSWVAGYYTGVSPYRDISSLSPSTPYYFRIQARNSVGTTSGAEKSFTTDAAPETPTVSTNVANAITNASARLNSYLDDEGSGVCTIRFEYDTDSGTPYANNTAWEGNYYTGASPYADISGLIGNTTYYFRVQADNDAGTSSGSEFYFTTDGPPTITTNDAIYVTTVSARLKSYLSKDGGEVCEVRFEYNTSSGVPYAYNTTWVDGYTEGQSPYANIDGLTQNTTYYFRAQADNSIGLANGSEKSFTTVATTDAPTNFVALPSSHNVSLSWTKSAGATRTMVRFQLGGYPATNTSGTQIYLDDGNFYKHTGLTPGTTYYYRAWGESAGNYTEDYASVMATTTTGTEPGEGPAAFIYPPSWWQSPDYTVMENVPGYDIINGIADTMHMPYATWWLVITLGFCMTSGLFLYSRTRNLVLSIGVIAVFMIVASVMGLLPLWMMAVFAIIAIGLSAKAMR